MRIEANYSDALLSKAEACEEAGDLKSAFECLLSGANAEHVICQLNLGNLYAQGKGCLKSYGKAAYWYRKAYRNGNSDGALNLAIDQRNQGNMRSAVLWLKRAIAMGDGEAALLLAKMYLERKGQQPDAKDLLRRVATLACTSEDSREEAKELLDHLEVQAIP